MNVSFESSEIYGCFLIHKEHNYFSRDKVSYSLGCPQTPYLGVDGFQLLIVLPQPTEYWCCRHVMPCLTLNVILIREKLKDFLLKSATKKRAYLSELL